MIREVIRAVRKKRRKTEVYPPSPEPMSPEISHGTGGLRVASEDRRTAKATSKFPRDNSFVGVESETRAAECGAVNEYSTSEIENQTNPFLVCMEREINDEEVYDEIIESEMIKDTDLLKN